MPGAAVRYIGTGVAVTATFKFAGYRSRAREILDGDFRAHSSVVSDVDAMKRRRVDIYRKVVAEILDRDDPALWAGKKPEDFRGCFRVGGGVHTTADDRLLEETYEGIIASIGLSEGTPFTAATIQKFREAVRDTVWANRRDLWRLGLFFRGNARVFFMESDELADRLAQKVKGAVPNGGVYKGEIKRLACSMVHAASTSQPAIFVTTEEAFVQGDTYGKVMGQVSRVLGLKRDDCPGLEHLGGA